MKRLSDRKQAERLAKPYRPDFVNPNNYWQLITDLTNLIRRVRRDERAKIEEEAKK